MTFSFVMKILWSSQTVLQKNIVLLFQVAQIGFKGVKKLNRVQSVVFDTAYNTNENLLICAPTGAGKTNVAMATILREVKQNIKQGVVMKDKFKVGGLRLHTTLQFVDQGSVARQMNSAIYRIVVFQTF